VLPKWKGSARSGLYGSHCWQAACLYPSSYGWCSVVSAQKPNVLDFLETVREGEERQGIWIAGANDVQWTWLACLR
jgi:hypothetical protein